MRLCRDTGGQNYILHHLRAQVIKVLEMQEQAKTIQMKAYKHNLFRACYSKGVNCHHLLLADAQRQIENTESFKMGEKKKTSNVCDWRLLTQGRCSQSTYIQAIVYNWFGERILHSLIVTKFKVRQI